MHKYRMMRAAGFDPLAAALIAILSGMFQPPGVVRLLNVEYTWSKPRE